MTRFCFIHGWAFSPDMWQAISDAFPDDEHTFVDLGFFGHEQKQMGDFDVVVTHSYGLMWLLKNPAITFDKLISVSGITSYVASKTNSIPKAQIRAMRTQLTKDPQALLTKFYIACGETHNALKDRLDINRLNQALVDMEELDVTPKLSGKKVLALASTEDKIVPATLTKENFAGHRLIWHDSDSHILPLSAPDWCTHHIKEFIHAS